MIVCYSRQPFSLLLHIVEEANDRCVCTERVVSEASQRQNFHATCPPSLQLEPNLAVDSEWLLPNDGIRP
ncbi:hypothetical protein T07_11507 [Trichinella nelsoni]|uniref:Uncharacterized protein n=1 Tax=Trichinella nelsoni TaxID=6336 RepID=A0A0V0SIV5_9BILA|nr:hypothetical protein T07_11507 [Trichinella nelsoni]